MSELSICRICGVSTPAKTYQVREMIVGSGEVFEYFQCCNCGCLQPVQIPSGLCRYYGATYYSVRPASLLKRAVINIRTSYVATGRGALGSLVARRWPPERDRSLVPTGIQETDRILDVGCGNGTYVRKLFELGFRNLHGIDPYMARSYQRSRPFRLERASIFQMPGVPAYDVVLFNHSFEHIEDQRGTLSKARSLLADGGACIVRIPFSDSYAWAHYRADWVQLDAPRHLFLHTARSLDLLARHAGLTVERMICDSTSFQFWGSEQYRRDIPLMAPNSWHVNGDLSPFSRDDIAEFERRAMSLNEDGRGDQVTAYLRPTPCGRAPSPSPLSAEHP